MCGVTYVCHVLLTGNSGCAFILETQSPWLLCCKVSYLLSRPAACGSFPSVRPLSAFLRTQPGASQRFTYFLFYVYGYFVCLCVCVLCAYVAHMSQKTVPAS